MELIVNSIFCDKSFLVTKTWKFFRHVGVPMWDTKMATLLRGEKLNYEVVAMEEYKTS